MSDRDFKDIVKALLVLPTIKREFEQILTEWGDSDGHCPYCSCASDEPHDDNCTILTIYAIVDDIYIIQ